MYISNVTTTGTGVILVPNQEVKTLTNATCYKLIIACNVEATANLPVFIQTTLGNIPVLCRFANTLYANQLRKRTMYRIGYGNANDNYDLGQFTIQSNVCPKSETVATTVTTTSKKKGE
jgi:S-adenosylmethionine synthetase